MDKVHTIWFGQYIKRYILSFDLILYKPNIIDK